MKFGQFWFQGRVSREFDYCLTSFDDARKFSVYWGGTQPLKPGPNGIMLGDVAQFDNRRYEWLASYDYGTGLRWFGGFKSKREASMFLLGAKCERDHAAKAHNSQGEQPMAEIYTGRVDLLAHMTEY